MLRGYHYTMLALTPLYHSSRAKAKSIAMHPRRPNTKLPVTKAYTSISTPASCTTLDVDVPNTCTPCRLSKASWLPCHSACRRLCRLPCAIGRQGQEEFHASARGCFRQKLDFSSNFLLSKWNWWTRTHHLVRHVMILSCSVS